MAAVEFDNGAFIVSSDGLTHDLDGLGLLLVDAKTGAAAVLDSCSRDGVAAWHENIKSTGVELSDILWAYATHAHLDHVFGLATLPRAQVFVGAGDLHTIRSGNPERTAAHLYGYEPLPIPHAQVVRDGHTRLIGQKLLTVYETPGHTPGSTSQLITTPAATYLNTGDLLWGGYHPHNLPSIRSWQGSLLKTMRLHPDFVFFGHGVSRPIPNLRNEHLILADERLAVTMEPSHGGKYWNIHKSLTDRVAELAENRTNTRVA